MKRISHTLASVAAIAWSAQATAGDPITFTVTTNPFVNASTNVQPMISIDSLWLDATGTTPRYRVFTDPESTIAQHLQTLAGSYGVRRLRVGARGADLTYWTTGTEATPGWAVRGRITPASITALSTFATAINHGIILHANLEQYRLNDPDADDLNAARDRALNMVDYAARSDKLGSRLTAVFFGAEPDFDNMNYDGPGYIADWNSYLTRLRQLPNAGSKPVYATAATKRQGLHEAFVAYQLGLSGGPNIAAITHHNYFFGACNDRDENPPVWDNDSPLNPDDDPAAENLLDWSRWTSWKTAAERLAKDGRDLGVPAVVDERNSIVCGGRPGVSDAFAASLWGLDTILLTARSGISRQYFHSSFGKCETPIPSGTLPLNIWYSAFCAVTDSDVARGRVRAQPLYYGLLAAHVVGDGTFLQSTVTEATQQRTRVYTLRQGTGLSVVMINVEGSATQVTANLDKAYSSAGRANLSASSLAAKTGITLGGGRHDAGERHLHGHHVQPRDADQRRIALQRERAGPQRRDHSTAIAVVAEGAVRSAIQERSRGPSRGWCDSRIQPPGCWSTV